MSFLRKFLAVAGKEFQVKSGFSVDELSPKLSKVEQLVSSLSFGPSKVQDNVKQHWAVVPTRLEERF